MSFLSEAGTFLRSFVTERRARRDFAAVNDGEALTAIVADAEAEQGRAATHAYTAEQADLEAARLLAAAQDPASEGGRNITPREAAPIVRHITNSARHDHQACQILA